MHDIDFSDITSDEYDKSLYDNKRYPFERICIACGRPFRTLAANQVICSRQHYHHCPICGKLCPVKGRNFNQWASNCCSNTCKHMLTVSHIASRKCLICGEEFVPTSGVNLICPKEHHRICEICGRDFVVDRSNSRATTCSKRCSQKKTSRKLHGTDHPMQDPEVRKHHEAAMKIKYGESHALKLKKFVEKQQKTVVKTNMDRYGVPYASMLPQCISSQGKIISETNHRAAEYLRSHNVDCIFEKRFDCFSYDLCVESLRFLIEIDPTYTHSIIKNHFGISREYDYQLRKTQVANQYGYNCIHIFDWDNCDRVLNMLLPRKSIYARDCSIYKLNNDVAKKFIVENDIKGNCRGQLLFLGLVYNQELYQVMSFGHPRFSKSYDVELMRLCTRSGYQVLGGASKLFKFATQDYGLNNIIAYCDIAKYAGEVFEKMGMKLSNITPPQEIWSKNSRFITANLLRQKGAKHLLKDQYDNNLDNEENMLANGWLPIFDCGMKVYTFK